MSAGGSAKNFVASLGGMRIIGSYVEESAMRFLAGLAVLVLFLSPLVAAQNLSDSKSLSANERAGEKLFLQRCSLCHFGYAMNYQTYGPPVYKDVVIERGENAVRAKIMDGSPMMPGWKYSLKPSDVDNLIAYLKTVKKEDIPASTGSAGSSEADK
jgi:mono/diheme cytochrome c family protein